MIAKPPRGPGSQRLADAIQRLRGPGRLAQIPDCQRPEAPADLPTIHGLQLAAIEGRILKLEQQVSNQNRILLIGVIAIVGDIARQLLKP